jgi:hypothetical protein
MDKKYVNESEEVKQAYSFGTEVGHCSYISYLETELTKARSAMCEANSNAALAEVRELIKYSDAMVKILLYDDKIFHRDEMIHWQKQIEKVRAHIV